MSWLVLLTFGVTLLSSVVSGMGGGGGGFITMPYFLLAGLTPAHALATSKLTGIGTAAGSITALKGKGLVSRRLVVPFMLITGVLAIASAWLIPRFNPLLFQKAIAVVLIGLAPMFLFGLGALEANATKRVAQSVQAVVLFASLAVQGLVLWWHGMAGLVGSVIGSHIGTHIALKKGAGFIKIMLAVVMVASGIMLLL